jgi:hypothetical protein
MSKRGDQKTKAGKKLPRQITAVTPTRIPDEHLHAIGYVTHQWTLVEVILERLCVMLLQLPTAEGRLVFGRMDTLRKLDILDVLVRYRLRAGACRSKAIAFLKRSRDLNGKRNGVVHGRWVEVLSEHDEILHFALTGKPRKRVQPEAQAQTAADLVKLGDAIRKQVIDGGVILYAAPAALLPLNDKSQ